MKRLFGVASGTFFGYVVLLGWHSHNADTPIIMSLGLMLVAFAVWVGAVKP